MSAIVFSDFRGSKPARSPKLLADNLGQVAENVYIESGNLTPLLDTTLVGPLGKTGTLNTLYKLGDTWLHWNEIVSVARMPISNNALNRVVFTGTDIPRVTDETLAAEGGGVNYPEVSYALGVPAPDTILTAQVVQNIAEGLQIQWNIAGTVDDGIGNKIARVYTYTFVNQWGQESAPADPSDLIYAGDDDTVHLSNFASVPIGPYDITHVRIYRSVAGSPGNVSYLLVEEVAYPVVPDPYVDDKSTADLGESLDTALWDAPPDDLQGITNMANGILAGYIENDLYFSEPYQGHAFPVDYKRTLDYKVTGIASVGNMLIVTTEGYPYIVTGNHPTLLTLNKLEQQQACVSERSIVEISTGAIYASSEGLVMISGNSAMLITDGVYPKRTWKDLNPSTMHGYFYKNMYIGFHDTGSFQFDLRSGDFITSTQTADSAFSDMVTGKLHLTKMDPDNFTNTLHQFDSDEDSPLTLRWLSKKVETSQTNIEAFRVSAVDYPVQIRLIADGDDKGTVDVFNDEPRRFQRGYTARVWEVEVRSIYDIYTISIADDVDSLK